MINKLNKDNIKVIKKIFLTLAITSLITSPAQAINYPTLLIKDNSYNYIVKIYPQNNKSANCSGVIYNSRFILTAAHCVVNYLNSEKIIVERNNGVKRKVIGLLHHSDYKGILSGDDIGLLLIDREFSVSNIIVANQGKSEKTLKAFKEKLIVAGYGLNERREESKSLAVAEQRDISEKGIKIIGDVFNSNKMIAAGKWDRKIAKYSGACEGDSGGGLFTNEKLPTLVGLVSFGSIDCANGEPTVYTKVGYYFNWIKENQNIFNLAMKNIEIKSGEEKITINSAPYLRDLQILCQSSGNKKQEAIIKMNILAPIFEITSVKKGNYMCLVSTSGGIVLKKYLTVT